MNVIQRHVTTRIVDYAWAYRVRFGALRRLDPGRMREGTKRPVLLLPGVYETWHFLRAAGEHLAARGHPVHVVPTFGRNVRPIGEMAELAGDYLERARLTDIVIVAHSKGGLIGKTLMLADDRGARVAAMVAINTPFGGSDYAHLIPIRPLREFVPTHETIVTLAGNAVVNSRITSIYSAWDPIVPNGSVLEGATNLEIPVNGHFRILDRPDVLAAVDRVVSGA